MVKLEYRKPGEPYVRYMSPRDVKAVAQLEDECYEASLIKESVFDFLMLHKNSGCVVAIDDQMLGYMLYRSHNRSVEVLRIGVAAHSRRRGLGSLMLKTLAERLNGRRTKIRFVIPETCDARRKFLSSQGYRARLLRGYFPDEDAYAMEYSTLRPPIAEAACEVRG